MTSAEPKIEGFLLMNEGKLDGAPVIKGVFRDNNRASAENSIRRRRLNELKVFERYSETCDIGEMEPFY